MLFRDRQDAGRQLARLLTRYEKEEPLVLGLPRGGVQVASEISRALKGDLDVWGVRKIGAPEQPEFALGAVAEGGVVSIDRDAARWAGVSAAEIDELIERKRQEVEERTRRFRDGRPAPSIEGRTVILVDDGIATGRTMEAAVASVRTLRPRRLIVAAPIADTRIAQTFRALADELVLVDEVPGLIAIGRWYENFDQTSDEEVIALLGRGNGREGNERDQTSDVEIELDDVRLSGVLGIPSAAIGLVIFAHGSGSSRFSPRNRQVASRLRSRGLATLLFDLLTPVEEREDALTAELRFDIDFLAERLAAVTKALAADPAARGLKLGYFGASTGAAAALAAAARKPELISAIVSRGGRPDLAAGALAQVRAPTLLLVGERDRQVLDLNRSALGALGCEKELQIVPGATHLFEEPGALEQVARLAAEWFERHFVASAREAFAPAP